ncbi:glycoside hydrolase superfamily [Phakopsora pachyrhizi]|uniref:mannan endo-1,4-beta-mannosidase n=1 Tax=Phakopsora pachyrhizi TaxID=170000 RepID=A0AAV0BEI9_PHAPC|nr:glycoside hydrolase superfamily [Phakopsora pachyrhizi]CAH7685360.1 glycoside hydrolase superfamily [Phakopsora pachyrhizi]
MINDDQIFKLIGPNIYWLGLDENVNPSPSYPSQSRILEALATAALMGSTVVRSTTLGISVGHQLSVWPSLNSTNQEALKVIGFTISAAQRYGLKLIIPLTDQYDYYHGGYKTFLRWRNLSDSSESVFYDTKSVVHQDFLSYISVLLNYINPYTNLAIKDDPTVLIWETGNELSKPAKRWTESVSNHIHQLAPNQFVASGRYGLDKDDLKISSIDAVTNHFYPPRTDHFHSDSKLAAKYNKVYYAGEFDWSGRSKAWGQLGWVLIPVSLSILILFLGKKLFPIRINWKPDSKDRYTTSNSKNLGVNKNFNTDLHARQCSPSPSRFNLIADNQNNPKDRSILIQQHHVSIFLLIFVVPLTVCIIYFSSIQYTGLETFLNGAESNQDSSGDLFWSLFGHDDQCCDWVEHSDGYTLHYPGKTNDERGSVARLIEHNYKMRSLMNPKSSSNKPSNNFDSNQLSIKTNKMNFKLQTRDDWFSFGSLVNLNCSQSLNL